MREDERESREFVGVAMNVGLGLRTGSYGSLQQQQLLQNSVALSIQCSPVSIRKPSKMTVAREKEKVLSRICKVVGRRRVGMLLLAITSLVVFVSILSVFSKDEVSESPDTYWPPLRSLSGFHRSPSILSKSPLTPLADELNSSLTLVSEIPPPAGSERELQGATPEVNTSIDFSEKYCVHFALSPPPADKKRTGPRPCDVCYIPMEHATNLMPTSPSISPLLQNLTYLSEGNSYANESNGGSLFGGHQSLQDRNNSFEIKESMSVHCGFYKGSKPGRGSGFDIDEMDLLEMEKCHGVVVASAIFGNYDILQQPRNISEMTKRNTCFFMFVDEETDSYIRNSTIVDSSRKVGLWRLVIVRNLPYTDARRNGKVPKLLLHRLFPNVRYSLWIDGKLELVKDPYQILERFLWRKKATFAISRHYRRFDVFVEAEANKAAGKYNNASIDHQIEFYKNEGLTHYSEAKLPITSDVPEGCVIIREHIPITNLFTCLWFNEVDRFTSRDQISFSTVRDKIMARVNWNVSMFLDCERRNFVIQAYHRDLLEQKLRSLSLPPPPPLLLPINETRIGDSLPEPVPEKPAKTVARSSRRGRDRRSGSRRHHPKTNGKDSNSI